MVARGTRQRITRLVASSVVADPEDDSRMPDEDPVVYINRVRAEIEADAELRRRRDPELQRREREIERAWIDVAPPGAAGPQRELLLDRADRLAMIDVDAPLGARPGVRQVKGAIRKGTYWYLRYVTDQVNALNNVMTRLVRRLDERIAEVESAVHLDELDTLIDAPPEPSTIVADAVAALDWADGRIAVLSCGAGNVARALHDSGRQVYGVDQDALAILPGVRDGIDLRSGDPIVHLREIEDGTLGGVVLAGMVENLAPAVIWNVLNGALRAVGPGGVVAIAAASPRDRDLVESELRASRGISAETWAHLAERAGAVTEMVPTSDPRIAHVVVARRV